MYGAVGTRIVPDTTFGSPCTSVERYTTCVARTPGIGRRRTGSIENFPGPALDDVPGAAAAGAAANPSAATRLTQNSDVTRTAAKHS